MSRFESRNREIAAFAEENLGTPLWCTEVHRRWGLGKYAASLVRKMREKENIAHSAELLRSEIPLIIRPSKKSSQPCQPSRSRSKSVEDVPTPPCNLQRKRPSFSLDSAQTLTAAQQSHCLSLSVNPSQRSLSPQPCLSSGNHVEKRSRGNESEPSASPGDFLPPPLDFVLPFSTEWHQTPSLSSSPLSLFGILCPGIHQEQTLANQMSDSTPLRHPRLHQPRDEGGEEKDGESYPEEPLQKTFEEHLWDTSSNQVWKTMNQEAGQQDSSPITPAASPFVSIFAQTSISAQVSVPRKVFSAHSLPPGQPRSIEALYKVMINEYETCTDVLSPAGKIEILRLLSGEKLPNQTQVALTLVRDIEIRQALEMVNFNLSMHTKVREALWQLWCHLLQEIHETQVAAAKSKSSAFLFPPNAIYHA